MKLYPTLGIVTATFIAGLMIGREFFPNQGGTPSPATEDGNQKPAKRLFADRDRGGGEGKSRSTTRTPPAAGASSLAELFELVDASDSFATGYRLRDALGNLSADELEGLLVALEDHPQTDPKFNTMRNSLFNYLALVDPSRALAFTLGHPDKQFRQLFTAQAIKILAKSDLAAAREALDQIGDQNLRISAHNTILSVAVETGSAEIAALLGESETNTSPVFSPYGGYFSGGGMWDSSFYGGYGGLVTFHPNINGTISQWAAKDPAAAEIYARGIEDSGKRTVALTSVAQGRAQTDPEGALAWAQGLDRTEGRSNAIMGVLGVLTHKDPQLVASMLDEVDSVQHRNSLIGTVASSWVRENRSAALAWLDSLPASQAKSAAYQSAVQQISQENPRAAIGLLDRLPLNARNQAISSLVSAWSHKDLSSARDWVTGLEDPADMNHGLNSLFATWSKQDPLGALDFLEGSGDLQIQNRSSHYGSLASSWAQEDSGAALDWAQGIADEKHRKIALSSLYNQLASRDPQDTAARLDGVTDPGEREILLNSIAANWAARDPQATLEWYDQLGAEDRVSVRSSAINNLSNSDPARAAAWYDRMAAEADADQRSDLQGNASSIAQHWSAHDPLAAADWAMQIADETRRSRAVDNVASNWVQFDPVGASAWIAELPQGEARDGAASRLVDQVSKVDPVSAFEWAQSISSEQKRFNAVTTVIGHWKNTDREAARRAVAEVDVTPQQREQLQRRLK